MRTRHNEWLTRPLWHEVPFDFGNEKFFKQGVDSMQELVKRYATGPADLRLAVSLHFRVESSRIALKCRVDQRTICLHEKGATKSPS